MISVKMMVVLWINMVVSVKVIDLIYWLGWCSVSDSVMNSLVQVLGMMSWFGDSVGSNVISSNVVVIQCVIGVVSVLVSCGYQVVVMVVVSVQSNVVMVSVGSVVWIIVSVGSVNIVKGCSDLFEVWSRLVIMV